MFDWLAPARVLRWAPWPLAVAALAALFELAQVYKFIPAAFVDLKTPASLAGYIAAKVLAGGLLVFLFAGVIPRMFWRVEPEMTAFLGAVVSAAYFAAFSYGQRNITFHSFQEVTPWALVVLGHLWVRGQDDRAKRWFYSYLPLFVICLCALGFWFWWAAQFPFRRAWGDSPVVALAAVTLAALVLAAPLLRRAPGRFPKLVATLGVSLVLAVLAGPVLRDNYRMRSFEPAVPGALDPSHIILIVVDTLRADALSYRADEAPPTPHIDALARESVVFENAIAPSPWTWPSMNSMMTGVALLTENSGRTYRAPKLPTLAEFLLDHGYHTQALIGNPLLCPPQPVADGLLAADVFSFRPTGDTGNSRAFGERFPFEFVHGGATTELTDRAIQWAAESVGRPSFLWLHYLDPHSDYSAPRPYLDQRISRSFVAEDRSVEADVLRSAYDAEVRYVDDSIGRFIEALKQTGIHDGAVIILTSDHGEEFWEHGGTGHGQSLYQELLHVPFLIRLPGGKAAKRVSAYVPTQALLPTLLNILDIDPGPQSGWAPSLHPFLRVDRGGEAAYPAPIISGAVTAGEFRWSLILEGRKYIQHLQSGREEIYDLAADPRELRPLPESAGFAKKCREILQSHHTLSARLREEAGIHEREPPEEFKQQLRALGYLQ